MCVCWSGSVCCLWHTPYDRTERKYILRTNGLYICICVVHTLVRGGAFADKTKRHAATKTRVGRCVGGVMMITIILSSRVLLNDDVDDMATHHANTRGRAATGWCYLGLDDDDGYGSDVCGGLCVWVGLRDTNPVVDGIPILYIHSVSHVLFPYSSFASGCRARFNRSTQPHKQRTRGYIIKSYPHHHHVVCMWLGCALVSHNTS